MSVETLGFFLGLVRTDATYPDESARSFGVVLRPTLRLACLMMNVGTKQCRLCKRLSWLVLNESGFPSGTWFDRGSLG